MTRIAIWAIIALALLLLLSCIGVILPLQVVAYLAAGWAIFLHDTVPTVRISGTGVATAAVTIVLLWIGVDRCGRWLYREMTASTSDVPHPAWRSRWTRSAIGAVLLAFVAGISMVGMTHQAVWILTSADPIVLNTSKEFRRGESRNNLKLIGLALLNYHDSHKAFPPGGTFDRRGLPQHSWQALLLPYLDGGETNRGAIDFSRPWTDPINKTEFTKVIPAYRNPVVERERLYDGRGYALTHYAANGWVIGGHAAYTSAQITDGTSNTILAGEVNTRFKPWGDPTNWRDPGLGVNKSPNGFGGPWSVGAAHFLLADGSVRIIYPNTDPKVLKALSTPDGGEPADDF
jgi:hypothetical protein